MNKPVLVIMAAGMGSRYGGLKQIDPVDEQGHIIIDFSIYDAIRAGFEKVIFIIKRENEAEFRACIGDRIQKHIQVEYVFQELNALPEGFSVPENRKKPFGTGHAVLCAMPAIHGSFVVINADDYYGVKAFQLLYDFLMEHPDDGIYRYAMVGYILENTLTEYGYVARGVCTMNRSGMLKGIRERTHIESRGGITAYTEDNGRSWTEIPAGSIVSMNMWGFNQSLLQELKKGFPVFLRENQEKNPLKCEYYLPFAVDNLVHAEKATVQVLTTDEKWYGVTYQEDKPVVMRSIQALKDQGLYPQNLWEDPV